MAARPRPVVLCVLDGFGHRESAPDNAPSVAQMPVWDKLWESNPHAFLEASGEDVGLPKGQIGNSEVGHMNLGAGRVVFQDLPMIDRAIEAGELAASSELSDFIKNIRDAGGRCHLMGLASPGGVHAHQDHFITLAKLITAENVPVSVHAFLDGRDVPPQSAGEQIAKLENDIADIDGAHIATLCGRYYAMDRDKRWDRTEKAYRLLVKGDGKHAASPRRAIDESYAAGVTDEFLLPVALDDYAGMDEGDGVLFVNFRADRARQILLALLDPDFKEFSRTKTVDFSATLGMVEYSARLNELMTTLFPPKKISNTLGEIVSAAGLKQLRIAETEKYPHVTFFFNGGREEPYEGEERIMVQSPKVATYDLQPEMSAAEVTDKIVEAIEGGTFDLMILNFANPDMVGHTGSTDAVVKALEALDGCLGRLLDALEKVGGAILATADHGNCEIMYNPETQGPHTAHTLSKVPVVLAGAGASKLREGRLADVAPTLLQILGIEKPKEMDGETLVLS